MTSSVGTGKLLQHVIHVVPKGGSFDSLCPKPYLHRLGEWHYGIEVFQIGTADRNAGFVLAEALFKEIIT